MGVITDGTISTKYEQPRTCNHRPARPGRLPLQRDVRSHGGRPHAGETQPPRRGRPRHRLPPAPSRRMDGTPDRLRPRLGSLHHKPLPQEIHRLPRPPRLRCGAGNDTKISNRYNIMTDSNIVGQAFRFGRFFQMCLPEFKRKCGYFRIRGAAICDGSNNCFEGNFQV